MGQTEPEVLTDAVPGLVTLVQVPLLSKGVGNLAGHFKKNKYILFSGKKKYLKEFRSHILLYILFGLPSQGTFALQLHGFYFTNTRGEKAIVAARFGTEISDCSWAGVEGPRLHHAALGRSKIQLLKFLKSK